MELTEKDFYKVAKLLKNKTMFANTYIEELTIRAFVKWFDQKNSKFNENKFRKIATHIK